MERMSFALADAPRRADYRVIGWLLLPTVAMQMVFMGLLQVLLPSHIAAIDALHKVENLGLVTGIGALVATLANPAAGAWSDRTRSRWGRRTPWLLGTALAACAALALMGLANSIAWLAVGFCLVQGVMNANQAVITAVMPERVGVARRGLASSVVGMGFPLGIVCGAALASHLLARPMDAYLALGALLLAATVLFVAFNRDRGALPPPRPGRTGKLAPRAALAGFFAALSAHDFRWTFISRFFCVLTYCLPASFFLYMLQDHVALAPGQAPAQVLVFVSTVQMGCMAAATLVGGPLSDYCGGRRRIFVVCAALGMAASLVFPLAMPTYAGMLLFAIANGISFGVYLAVDTALVTQVLPNQDNVARDMGILNIANAGPQIIAPFIGAQLVTYVGGYPALLTGAIVSALLAAGTVLYVRTVR